MACIVTQQDIKQEIIKMLPSSVDKTTLLVNDNSIVGRYGNTHNVSSLLKAIETSNVSNKTMAELAKHLQQFSDINNVKIDFYTENEKVEFLKQYNNSINSPRGYYDPNSNSIKIMDNSMSNKKIDQFLIHEILHALSYRQLRENSAFSTDFQKYYEHAKKYFQPYNIETKQGTYATHTIDEFFVALFTDSIFVKQLKDIPSLGNNYKNHLYEIFDKILSVLGITKDRAFYSEAFALSTNILQEAKGIVESLQEINKTFNSAQFGDVVSLATPDHEIIISRKEMSKELGISLPMGSISELTLPNIRLAIRRWNNKNINVAHYQASYGELTPQEKVGKSPLYKKIVVKKFGVGSQRAAERMAQVIQIHPSQELADAMTRQNKLDEGKQLSLFDSKYNEEAKLEKPIGDNYGELFDYKQKELAKIQRNLQIAKNNIKRYVDVKDSEQERSEKYKQQLQNIKVLEASEQKVLNQLHSISKKSEDLLFHAVELDLDELSVALKSSELVNIPDIKDKIEFYQSLIPHFSDYDHPKFSEISKKILTLAGQYEKDLEKKVLDFLNNDYINTIIDNENKERREQGNDYTPMDIKDLLIANQDLNYADAYLLGLNSSTRGDTIIPQSMMLEFSNIRLKHQNNIEYVIDRLNNLENKNPSFINAEWLFSQESPGRLIDVFSKTWYKEEYKKRSKIRALIDTIIQGVDTTKAYKELMAWYSNNANIINFFKLPEVYEIYQGRGYDKYLIYKEEDMNSYKAELEAKLGPRYNETIKQILNKLQKFEQLKTEAIGNYAERNIAQQNVWEFLNNYNQYGENTYSKIGYTFGNGQTSIVHFMAFEDLAVLPKEKVKKQSFDYEQGIPITIDADTGFYSQEFKDAITSNERVQLWSLYKEMTDYINETYEIQGGEMSYPKIRREILENFGQHWKTVPAELLNALKSTFFEEGRMKEDMSEISPNYIDSSKKEISKLRDIYLAQGLSWDEAVFKASKEITPFYSKNISSIYKATLINASLHNARLEASPTLLALQDFYKGVKNKDGKKINRARAEQRLQHWLEKTINNNNMHSRGDNNILGKELSGSDALKYIKQILYNKDVTDVETFKYLTEPEKLILKKFKELRDTFEATKDTFRLSNDKYTLLYDTTGDTPIYIVNDISVTKKEFEDAMDRYMMEEINDLGIGLNIHGLITGVQKVVIFNKLALSPFSGVYNRVEGYHAAMVMDLTGEYWTAGNFDNANQFLNFYVSGHKILKLGSKNSQYDIFDAILNRFSILQDRKDELQRNASSGKFNFNWKNIYAWAVEYPESKNQGTIALAVMMDHTINGIPVFNKKTNEFNFFTMNNGVLTPKPGYEDILSSQEMFNLMDKITNAISHSQGNYNPFDSVMGKQYVLGSMAMLFKTYLPEHVYQRWGIQDETTPTYDLLTGKKRREGRYVTAIKKNKMISVAHMAAGLYGAYAFGTLGTILGIGGIAIPIAAIIFAKQRHKQSVMKEMGRLSDLGRYLFETVTQSLNYIPKFITDYNIINIDTFKKSVEAKKITQEEAGVYRAMAQEMAILINIISIKLAIGFFVYDDDDDASSHPRKVYYKVQNQLSRLLSSIQVYTDPYAFASDQSRLAIASTLYQIPKIAKNIREAEWGDATKNTGKILLPGIVQTVVKGSYIEDNYYADESAFNSPVAPYKWTTEEIKNKGVNIDTKGEYQAKKEYEKDIKEIKRNIKNIVLDAQDDKDKVKQIVDKIYSLKYKSKPDKKKYIDFYPIYQKAQKVPFKFTEDEYNRFTSESIGLTRSQLLEIEKIMSGD